MRSPQTSASGVGLWTASSGIFLPPLAGAKRRAHGEEELRYAIEPTSDHYGQLEETGTRRLVRDRSRAVRSRTRCPRRGKRTTRVDAVNCFGE